MPGGAADAERLVVTIDGEAGGIIAAVFQLLQAIDNDRYGSLRPDIADNSAHVTPLYGRLAYSVQHFDAVIFDHGIAENVARDGVEVFARLHRDLEELALTDLLDALWPKAVQRGADGLALRVENRRFEGYVNAAFT